LATTTKSYEEQIAMMSEHLASMNEQITSQNDKIDKLNQQLHFNSKVKPIDLLRFLFAQVFFDLGREKRKKIIDTSHFS